MEAVPEDIGNHPEPVAKLLLNGGIELPEAVKLGCMFLAGFWETSLGRRWPRVWKVSSFFLFGEPSAPIDRQVASRSNLVRTDIMTLH